MCYYIAKGDDLMTKEVEIGKRIKECRLDKGMTQEELAKTLGVNKSTIQRYESGEIKAIKLVVLQSIAKTLNIDALYITLKSDIKKPYELTLPTDIIPLKKLKKIPIIGKIACGSPILAEQNFESLTYCPDNVNADFALRCNGDSMIDADIHDGDIVFIKEMPIVENGEIAAVVVGEESTLKRVYYQDDTLTLVPANSAYAPMVYSKEQLNEIRICGKVVALLRHMK